jgi:ABC-type sugar transport system permease subunit
MAATGALKANAARERRLPKAPSSLVGFTLMLPAMAIVAVFHLYPLIRGVALSLHDPSTNGLTTHNYERMVHDPAWRTALVNAGEILLLVPVFVVVPLILAFALFQGFAGWRFFRAVFFMSWLMPPVIVGYMFTPLLGSSGPIGSVFKAIGLGGLARDWLGGTSTALWAVMAVFLWTIFGLGVGIYLAGLATVPGHLVEAARLDGASRPRILRHVIVPLLMPTIALWSVMVVSALLLGLYSLIYALTGGGPSFATLTPEYDIVNVLLGEVNPNYAAALGVTLFAGVFLIVVAQTASLYRRGLRD